MLQSLQDAISLQEDEDLESILEEQSEKDKDTQYCITSEKELGYLGSLGLKQIDGTPRPHFNLKVKASKYDRPVKAVALLDTGSCASIVKPDILPPEA
ncbi:hypothetical protein PIB30_084568 [Stylosanthes scabra]|uniref:Uncharacterized protein n=1 Tax=Stylosanthes scabra TaxID=79078 RepID=A0ABU6XUY1_9FABA|nr:hypothetical protein [Stylosanthes scabra]